MLSAASGREAAEPINSNKSQKIEEVSNQRIRQGKESNELTRQHPPQCTKSVEGFEEAATDGITESSS